MTNAFPQIHTQEEFRATVVNLATEYFNNIPGLHSVVAAFEWEHEAFRIAAVGDSQVLIDYLDVALPGGDFTSAIVFREVMSEVTRSYLAHGQDRSTNPLAVVTWVDQPNMEGGTMGLMEAETLIAGISPINDDHHFSDLALGALGHHRASDARN